MDILLIVCTRINRSSDLGSERCSGRFYGTAVNRIGR